MPFNWNDSMKWISVLLTVVAALSISLKLTDVLICYFIFLAGHGIMVGVMLKNRDWSLLTMNLVWLSIDLLGIFTWW